MIIHINIYYTNMYNFIYNLHTECFIKNITSRYLQIY